jgi:hypothetical protein
LKIPDIFCSKFYLAPGIREPYATHGGTTGYKTPGPDQLRVPFSKGKVST